MLRRAHRFHGYNSLNHVYRHGKTARAGGDFSTRYVLNTKRDGYRAAVVVSKKVHKSAVTRNRIRRRIFEQLRLLSDKIDQPYDMVVTVHSEHVADMPVKQLAELLKKQLEQADIIS